ncbi:inactive hydroxysteroid dehydrogenase-like protein 1 [Diorhabda carinulata]|uniref:inactive hydroxysteroid dehydrogenase-like protein 1 n=1 Tax=Diorhabda carinulata TaxID=1163345 RepID=UPI0025A10CD7|nr:inactive hydroxysteroid dehydrogenase-like protein 1 [Diorhabda carinulata]
MWDLTLPYSTHLALIGLMVVIYIIFEALWNSIVIIIAILTPFFNPNEDTSLLKKFGPWALVTGSTDGIGKAYALELAKRGINIVLVSRNEEKLKKTAEEIENKHLVKTKIIVADFSQVQKAVDTVKEKLGTLKIDILVNNVGKNYDYPLYLTEIPENLIVDIININTGAVTLMCRAFIEDMKKRGKGAIVNVSSGSELHPLPLMNVYAATKAYVKSFTAGLRYEYRNSGVTIQHLAPFFVNTNMSAFVPMLQRNNFIVPNAENYAKFAVMTLGKLTDTSGFWSHGIQRFIIKMCPTWIAIHGGANLNKIFRRDYINSRKKYDK